MQPEGKATERYIEVRPSALRDTKKLATSTLHSHCASHFSNEARAP